MKTYRITYMAGKLDATICPPEIVSIVFPNAQHECCFLCEQYCDVTFSSEQNPVQISPLVKVELLTE